MTSHGGKWLKGKEGGKLLTGRVAGGRLLTLEGSGRGSGVSNVLIYFGQGKLCGGLGSPLGSSSLSYNLRFPSLRNIVS